MVSLGRGQSDPVRQTMKVKWDGSGLKLSGRALARAAGVGTFSCPAHLTLGVIRACRQGESKQQQTGSSSNSSSSRGDAEGPASDLICQFGEFTGVSPLSGIIGVLIQQSGFTGTGFAVSGFVERNLMCIMDLSGVQFEVKAQFKRL